MRPSPTVRTNSKSRTEPSASVQWPYSESLNHLAARAVQHGGSCLTDFDLLSLVLADCTRSRQGPALAARLFDQFRSLQDVLTARPEAFADLLRRGLPPSAIQRLVVTRELGLRVLRSDVGSRAFDVQDAKVSTYLLNSFRGESRKIVSKAIYLDSDRHLIADEVLARSDGDLHCIYPREIVRRALELRAVHIVFVRSSKNVEPDWQACDTDLDFRLGAAAAVFDICIDDYLIIGGSRLSSRSMACSKKALEAKRKPRCRTVAG